MLPGIFTHPILPTAPALEPYEDGPPFYSNVVPYLFEFEPGLQFILNDPIPEAIVNEQDQDLPSPYSSIFPPVYPTHN